MNLLKSCDITEELLNLEPTCPGVLGGVVMILGTPMHVTLVRVATVGGVQDAQPIDGATHYDALAACDPGGAFQTTQLDGYEGDWVMYLTPFQE